MLLAAWVLAIATSIIAMAGLVAIPTWLYSRRDDRERRRKEQADSLRSGMLQEVKDHYVPRDWLTPVGIAVAFVLLLAYGTWQQARD